LLKHTTNGKTKGHIKYVGTLGEVRHFKIKGNEGYFAGLKGGPTAEQVKTAPGFIRTVKICPSLQLVLMLVNQ
jgi:hypothetical protein